MKDLKERATMYLCNDQIFETAEDAMIDCAECGIWGSDCKDHIEELPFVGKTRKAVIADIRERALNSPRITGGHKRFLYISDILEILSEIENG